jgi:hypothetical protein
MSTTSTYFEGQMDTNIWEVEASHSLVVVVKDLQALHDFAMNKKACWGI